MYSQAIWNRPLASGGGGSRVVGGVNNFNRISNSNSNSSSNSSSNNNNSSSSSHSSSSNSSSSFGNNNIIDGLSLLSIKRQTSPRLALPNSVYLLFRSVFESKAVNGTVYTDIFFKEVFEELNKHSLVAIPREIISKIISELQVAKNEHTRSMRGSQGSSSMLGRQLIDVKLFSMSWQQIVDLITEHTCLEVQNSVNFSRAPKKAAQEIIPYQEQVKRSQVPTSFLSREAFADILRAKGIDIGPFRDEDSMSPLKTTEFRQYLKEKTELKAKSLTRIDYDAPKRIERLMRQGAVDLLIECRRRTLTPAQHKKALDVLNKVEDKDGKDIVIDKFNIDMSRRKLRCLLPGKWLNDEPINFYMEMLKERDVKLCEIAKGKGEVRAPSHFFSSYFMSKLGDIGKYNNYTYANVVRWTKKFDIFTYRRIYCPINIDNSHWTLAVVHMDIKEIHYYDSFHSSGREYTAALLRWLQDEAKNKKQVSDYDISEWKVVPQMEIPQQKNGFDCGVFTITNSDFLSDDLPLTEDVFSQVDMPDFRMKIAWRILEGSLEYPLVGNVSGGAR